MIHIDASKTYQIIHGFGVTVPPRGDGQSSVYTRDLFELLVNDLGISFVRTLFLTQEGDTPDPHLLDLQLHDLHELRTLKPEVKLLGTLMSAPGYMKEKGSLKPDAVGELANYLLDMCSEFKQRSCPVHAISLQTGPFSGPSEGCDPRMGPLGHCSYTPELYHEAFKELCQRLESRDLKVKLMAPEDGITFLPVVSDVIAAIDADGQTSEHLDYVGARGYVIPSWASLEAVRAEIPEASFSDLYWYENGKFREAVEPYGRVVMAIEDCGETPVWKIDTDYGVPITPRDPQYFEHTGTAAVDLALKIRASLASGGASSYVYWLATTSSRGEGEGWSYGNDPSQALCEDGEPTCKYQAAKHFFKYIDPGMTRVSVSSDIATCAFKSPGKVVAVAINDSDEIVDTSVSVEGAQAERYTLYTSVENDYHQPESGTMQGGAIEVTLLPNSITTFVVE